MSFVFKHRTILKLNHIKTGKLSILKAMTASNICWNDFQSSRAKYVGPIWDNQKSFRHDFNNYFVRESFDYYKQVFPLYVSEGKPLNDHDLMLKQRKIRWRDYKHLKLTSAEVNQIVNFSEILHRAEYNDPTLYRAARNIIYRPDETARFMNEVLSHH